MTFWVYKLTLDESRSFLSGQVDEKRVIFSIQNNSKVKLSERYRKYLARFLEKFPSEINTPLKLEFEATHQLVLKIEKLKCEAELKEKLLPITFDEEDYFETQPKRFSFLGSLLNKKINVSEESVDDLNKSFIQREELELGIMDDIIKEMAKVGSVEPKKFSGKDEDDVNSFIKNIDTCAVLNGWTEALKLKHAAKAISEKLWNGWLKLSRKKGIL